MDWYKFWQTYRPIENTTKQDFLYQVGKTINGNPINEEIFLLIRDSIISGLNLSRDDYLIDLCCGNGVLTKELAPYVNSVTAIDFSKMFIDIATEHNQHDNIVYINDDVRRFPKYVQPLGKTTKILIYDALASFSKSDFNELIRIIRHFSDHMFLYIGAVLNNSNKFKFYNTFSRKLFYFYNIKLIGFDNGIGRWWRKEEINMIFKYPNEKVLFLEQDQKIHTSHYRFDILIKS